MNSKCPTMTSQAQQCRRRSWRRSRRTCRRSGGEILTGNRTMIGNKRWRWFCWAHGGAKCEGRRVFLTAAENPGRRHLFLTTPVTHEVRERERSDSLWLTAAESPDAGDTRKCDGWKELTSTGDQRRQCGGEIASPTWPPPSPPWVADHRETRSDRRDRKPNATPAKLISSHGLNWEWWKRNRNLIHSEKSKSWKAGDKEGRTRRLMAVIGESGESKGWVNGGVAPAPERERERGSCLNIRSNKRIKVNNTMWKNIFARDKIL